MRVLLVTGALPPDHCGVGSYTAQLASALARTPGVTVSILTGRGAAAAGPRGVDVLPLMGSWSLGEFGRVVESIRTLRPRIVHLQYPARGYRHAMLPSLILLIGWCLGSRVVRTWHEVTTWDRLADWRGVILFFVQSLVPGPIIVVRPNYRKLLHAWLRPFTAHRLRFIRSASSIPRSTLAAADLARLRTAALGRQKRLIIFFGFLLEPKGADLLFDIADPETDRILFLGGYDPDGACFAILSTRAATAAWHGKVGFSGFLPDTEIADYLAAADAVVLPFRDGAGVWNTSLLAAVAQGSYVVTTSLLKRGYDDLDNIEYSRPDDVASMKAALATPKPRRGGDAPRDWQRIAAEHLAIYASKSREARS